MRRPPTSSGLVRLYRPTGTKRTAEGKPIRDPRTGKPMRCVSPTWWADYRENGKRVRLCLKTTIRQDAELLRGKILDRLRLRQTGHSDPFAEHGARPLAEHVAAFRDTMAARNGSPVHVAYTVRLIQAAVAAMNAHALADLDLAAASRWLTESAASGLSASTVNSRAQALRAFGRWLLSTGRVPRNPFQGLPRRRVADEDRKRIRRALTVAEAAALIDAARRRPLAEAERKGLKLKDATRAALIGRGAIRALLYRFLLGTGLRRSEAEAVRWQDLDLDPKGSPAVTILASNAKSKREQRVDLSADLVAALSSERATREGEPRDAPVFPAGMMPNMDTFRRDLDAAGIPYFDADGTVVDLHALRVTLGTRLSDAGVPLVQAQRILRHSTPVLTANIYTRPASTDLRAALDRAAAVPGDRMSNACHVGPLKAPEAASSRRMPGGSPTAADSPQNRENDALEAIPAQRKLAPRPGFEPGTYRLTVQASHAETLQEPPVACVPQDRLPTACHVGTAAGGSVPLADALAALAGAGLSEDALRAAVDALLRAAQPAPATAPRLVGGA